MVTLAQRGVGLYGKPKARSIPTQFVPLGCDFPHLYLSTSSSFSTPSKFFVMTKKAA
nr:hypothetical protein [Pseudomonas syringae pv. actinidiae]